MGRLGARLGPPKLAEGVGGRWGAGFKPEISVGIPLQSQGGRALQLSKSQRPAASTWAQLCLLKMPLEVFVGFGVLSPLKP